LILILLKVLPCIDFISNQFKNRTPQYNRHFFLFFCSKMSFILRGPFSPFGGHKKKPLGQKVARGHPKNRFKAYNLNADFS
jgi:hypothetical protein